MCQRKAWGTWPGATRKCIGLQGSPYMPNGHASVSTGFYETSRHFILRYAWGNHFPFCTRGGKTPKLEPIVPWTTLIGQAFIEAYETFRDPGHLDVLASIADWITKLPREETDSGACISYFAFKQHSIHNSNMLAAAFLAQASKFLNLPKASTVARDAMHYSCARQRSDGAWMYGAAAKYQWNDNFHTGYNLDSLKRYTEATGDSTFAENLRIGYGYFKGHFFEQDGRPRYLRQSDLSD